MCRFVLNGHSVEDASLYSDAGTDESADLIQASRSLIMHLEDGDVLSLRKANTIHRLSPNPGADKRITFCISLRHLDAAMDQGMFRLLHILTKHDQSR